VIYVLRDGKLVPKSQAPESRRYFPAPRVSRFETIESPVTGKSVSSWRERDKDMNAANAVDPRDIPKAAFEKRKQLVERNARSRSDD
jgi:hypothetical protein